MKSGLKVRKTHRPERKFQGHERSIGHRTIARCFSGVMMQVNMNTSKKFPANVKTDVNSEYKISRPKSRPILKEDIKYVGQNQGR